MSATVGLPFLSISITWNNVPLTPGPGNVDYKGWFELDHSNFVKDADALLGVMDEACHAAGPEKCDLWAPSPGAIGDRRGRILEKLRKQPVEIPAWVTKDGPDMPELITYSRLQSLTREIVYKPLKTIEKFTRVYAALDRGDPIPYFEATRPEDKEDPMSKLLCSINDVPVTEPQETAGERDALAAIMCSDIKPFETTPDDFARYLEKLLGVSKWTGAASVLFRLPCVGRTVRPEWRVIPEGMSRRVLLQPLYIEGERDWTKVIDQSFDFARSRSRSSRNISPHPVHQQLVRQCHTPRQRKEQLGSLPGLSRPSAKLPWRAYFHCYTLMLPCKIPPRQQNLWVVD